MSLVICLSVFYDFSSVLVREKKLQSITLLLLVIYVVMYILNIQIKGLSDLSTFIFFKWLLHLPENYQNFE